MGRARTKRGRVAQVANYLRSEGFNPGYPVDIRFVRPASLPKKERLFGWAEKSGSRGRIVLVESSSSTIGLLIDTYIHELAHHLDGISEKGRDHGSRWALQYGKMITLLFDQDGIVESYDFLEKWKA